METTPDRPGRWRRFVRFSVRGLIVLVLAIAIALGWIVHRAQLQRDAVAAIRRAGGEVQYDWQYEDGQGVSSTPRGPKWLADRIGPDYFDTITTIWGKQPISDDDLKLIGQLAGLEVLNLRAPTTVSDAGLAALKGLTRLHELCLHSSQISDRGLARLANLTALDDLDLDGAKITGGGLKYLEGLTGLKHLSLSGTSVDDGLFVHLRGS